MTFFYIIAIAVLAIAARWHWFQNSKGLGSLSATFLGLALVFFVGFLFTPSSLPGWARAVIGVVTLFLGICAQDLLGVLIEKRQERRVASIPTGSVRHDFTVSGYESRDGEQVPFV